MASLGFGRRTAIGLAIGVVGGVLDTLLGVSLGIDFRVAGRDWTTWVAVYMAANFALICGAVGYFMDARARARRDAETIREQMRELEATQRIAAQNEKLAAIGRLAAGVAHEVRNPLGVIRASASMVQESFDEDDESHRACRFICEEIDRLNGLITSLLTFARPTEIHPRAVSLEKVLDRALQLADEDLRKRGVEVERSATGVVPEVVADPDLLAQLVFGLLTNAGEAVDEGGRIALRVEPDRESLAIEVADSGPGIEAVDAERVFEPFFTTKASGTGLGLPMAARIAQAHRGHIEVVQDRGAGPEGGGACFRIHLPLAWASEAAA